MLKSSASTYVLQNPMLMPHQLYYRFSLLFFFLFMMGSAHAQTKEMTNERMGTILKQEIGEVEGSAGSWQFIYGDHLVMVITDEAANRMRIFSPIIEEKDLEPGQYKEMLEANFHSALDAKYCLYEGFAIAVFTHPLRELSKHQLIDAARQVVNLAATFGTAYQSTGLIFSPRAEEEGESPKVNQKPKKKS